VPILPVNAVNEAMPSEIRGPKQNDAGSPIAAPPDGSGLIVSGLQRLQNASAMRQWHLPPGVEHTSGYFFEGEQNERSNPHPAGG
jgi:hypothetical protein